MDFVVIGFVLLVELPASSRYRLNIVLLPAEVSSTPLEKSRTPRTLPAWVLVCMSYFAL